MEPKVNDVVVEPRKRGRAKGTHNTPKPNLNYRLENNQLVVKHGDTEFVTNGAEWRTVYAESPTENRVKTLVSLFRSLPEITDAENTIKAFAKLGKVDFEAQLAIAQWVKSL